MNSRKCLLCQCKQYLKGPCSVLPAQVDVVSVPPPAGRSVCSRPPLPGLHGDQTLHLAIVSPTQVTMSPRSLGLSKHYPDYLYHTAGNVKPGWMLKLFFISRHILDRWFRYNLELMTINFRRHEKEHIWISLRNHSLRPEGLRRFSIGATARSCSHINFTKLFGKTYIIRCEKKRKNAFQMHAKYTFQILFF